MSLLLEIEKTETLLEGDEIAPATQADETLERYEIKNEGGGGGGGNYC
jgi:hypothetical protein